MSEIVCSKGKGRRGANFSKADLVFLCELVEKNITILRSKQTNSITNAEKAKVWKEITDSVNARAGGQKRSVEQIKEKWRKACSTAKLEAEIDKKSLNQIGGVQLYRRQVKLHKKSWNFTPRHQTLVSFHLYFRILPLQVSQPIKSSHMVNKVIIIKTHNTKRVL